MYRLRFIFCERASENMFIITTIIIYRLIMVAGYIHTQFNKLIIGGWNVCKNDVFGAASAVCASSSFLCLLNI